MDAYLQQRSTLIREAEPGLDAARELSRLTDAAVRVLADAAAPLLQGPWAVCALGGWGAGALLPASDLDLLVLSDATEGALKPFVEALLYPLWDAGLKVGHQTRTPKAHIAACRRGELETLTASLTARVVAGDAAFATCALDRVAADARKGSRTVLRRFAERERPGSPFLLEPNIKEGAGAKRDLDELAWTATVVSGHVAAPPSALVPAGVMTAEEATLVDAAAAVLTAARWELHLAGSGDLLSLDVARSLTGDPSGVHEALAHLWLILNRVRRRVGRDASRAGGGPAELGAAGLFALLDRGQCGLTELEEAAVAGELDELVPGIRDLMFLRRPGLAHTLTVGAHCLKSAATIADLKEATGPLAHSGALVTDVRALQTAALAHDEGKRTPGPGHAERGVAAAHESAHRLGLTATSTADAGDLVRLHLALVETALHEDLDDEDVVLRCAGRIARRELVAPLHLLTVADTIATGPSAWTPWFETLLARLVTRVDAALSPDEDGAGLVAAASLVRSEALSLAGLRSDAARAFLEAAPVRYLASRSAEEAVRDARLVSGLSAVTGAEYARIAVAAGPVAGTSIVTVAAWDRPNLLSRLAGACALAGLDILAFDAHGATGRVALDSFVVRSATDRPLTPEIFTHLERLVTAALRDRYELATRLEERRRHYPPRASAATRVEVRPSGWDTTVHVVTPDRPGLLHDLASAVSATGLDIRWARARTIDGIAKDTFHVVGADGGPVDDPGVLGHLTMRIRERL